jgi:hypothetical protein
MIQFDPRAAVLNEGASFFQELSILVGRPREPSRHPLFFQWVIVEILRVD